MLFPQHSIPHLHSKLTPFFPTDKAPPSEKSTAHSAFQRIAFAYAILSSPHRRTLYDTTGSTSETLAADDDDFNWLSFFQSQYTSLSASAVNEFSTSYKKSKEERNDILAAYTKHAGKMGKVYEEVMLSNPLEDETRFREIMDGAIASGEVEQYDAYMNETKKSKDARMKRAKREAEEAEKEAMANPKYQSIFGGDGKGGRPANGEITAADGKNVTPVDGKSSKNGVRADPSGKGDIGDLAAMIQSRNKARSDDFFDKLEAKYAGASATGKRKKGKAEQEPDEEAFEKNRTKMVKVKAERDGKGAVNGKAANTRKPKAATQDKIDLEDDEEEDEVIDLEKDTDGDDDELEHDIAEGDLEDEEVKPKRKAQKGRQKRAAAPVAKTKSRARGRKKK